MTYTPEQLRECPIDQCVENTDREIYRGPDDGCGDFYSDRLHITQEGALGIDCGGYVIVRPIRAWHGIAKAHAAALEEVEQLKRARDLLVMALHRATGQPKERIAEAPTSVAVEHAKQIVRAESALADAERKGREQGMREAAGIAIGLALKSDRPRTASDVHNAILAAIEAKP